MNDRRQRIEDIKAHILGGVTAPKSRHVEGPLLEFRQYRGKRQWVAGYWWTRCFAPRSTGIGYDAILGCESALYAWQAREKVK